MACAAAHDSRLIGTLRKQGGDGGNKKCFFLNLLFVETGALLLMFDQLIWFWFSIKLSSFIIFHERNVIHYFSEKIDRIFVKRKNAKFVSKAQRQNFLAMFQIFTSSGSLVVSYSSHCRGHPVVRMVFSNTNTHG